MKAGFKFLLIISCFSFSAVQAQRDIKEEVFLHTNATTLLTGESLYFSAYVRSQLTGKLTSLSSILYVELLDEQSQSVYQTKISLTNGRGYGDYFIPSLLSSGSYHLIAYTRWMKNFNDYFHLPLTIINPFDHYESPGENKVTFKWYPEGGKIVAGKENKIVFKNIDRFGRGVPFKGKFVNRSGDKLEDVIADESGIGIVKFVAKIDQSYQLILEDEIKGFVFYDIPLACTGCISLSVSNSGNNYLINPRLGPSFKDQNMLLRIYDNQDVYFEKPIESEVVVLDKSKLPGGLIKIDALDENGELMSTRLIYNGSIVHSKVETIEAEKHELVTVDFGQSGLENVSFSVGKVNQFKNKTAVFLQQINSELINKITLQENNYSIKALDDLLITSKSKWGQFEQIDSVTFMPEYRNDLLEGVVTSENNIGTGNVVVGLSIPGKDYQVSLTKSDSFGKFLINLDPLFGDWDGYLTVLDYSENSFTLNLNSEFYEQYPQFEQYPIYYDSAIVADIVNATINLQIENAYYDFKKDSIVLPKSGEPQFNDFISYNLDDYTRFPTIRDTFIELIPQVGVSKNEKDFDFKVRLSERIPGIKHDNIYLVLFDGIPASPKEVLLYSPYNIKKIEVLDKRYYIGPVAVDGIISLNTIDGDFYDFNSKGSRYKYKGIQPDKVYYFPDYIDDNTNRRADQREQLLWKPEFEVLNNENPTVSFYTSNVPGAYEIRMNGITENGEFVSLTKLLKVK